VAEDLKEKENLEAEVRCGGKVLVVDFSKLKEEDFPYMDFKDVSLQEQWALPVISGQLYVNKCVMDAEQFLILILEILMNHSRRDLNKFERMYRKKYRNLSLNNLAEFMRNHDDKRIVEAVYYLLIPMERARRMIEKNYYGN